MGRELIEENATFRKSIDICASVLKSLGLDLLAAFEKDDGFSKARMAAVGLASVQVKASSTTHAPPQLQHKPFTIPECKRSWEKFLPCNLTWWLGPKLHICILSCRAAL